MDKYTKPLQILGGYGIDNDSSYRYFFLREEADNLEKYKEDIIKCLKYDVLYSVLPDHTIGDKGYDHLNSVRQEPVEITEGTYGCFCGESIRNSGKGELVAVYKFSEDGKTVLINLYDRTTVLGLVQTSMDDETQKEYALLDSIVESQVRLTKGKKLTTKDIRVYSNAIHDKEHNYTSALKVVEAVKEKVGARDISELVEEKKPSIKK